MTNNVIENFGSDSKHFFSTLSILNNDCQSIGPICIYDFTSRCYFGRYKQASIKVVNPWPCSDMPKVVRYGFFDMINGQYYYGDMPYEED